DGNLYVGSAHTNNILRFSGKTGAFIDVFAQGGGLLNPNDIAFVPKDPGRITQAWHVALSPATDLGGPNPVVVDRSGNAYFAYEVPGANISVHLKKISPAEDPYFDAQAIAFPAGQGTVDGFFISPVIAGSQSLYLVWNIQDSSNNQVVNVVKYSTSGNAVWAVPTQISNTSGGDNLLGLSFDLAGNTTLALADKAQSGTQLK